MLFEAPNNITVSKAEEAYELFRMSNGGTDRATLIQSALTLLGFSGSVGIPVNITFNGHASEIWQQLKHFMPPVGYMYFDFDTGTESQAYHGGDLLARDASNPHLQAAKLIHTVGIGNLAVRVNEDGGEIWVGTPANTRGGIGDLFNFRLIDDPTMYYSIKYHIKKTLFRDSRVGKSAPARELENFTSAVKRMYEKASTVPLPNGVDPACGLGPVNPSTMVLKAFDATVAADKVK